MVFRSGVALGVLLLGCTVFGFAGCAPSAPPLPTPTKGTVPVSGTITLDGKPLDGVTIVMTGIEGAAYFCSGTSDSSGNFSLTGDEGQTKGALPGVYQARLSRIVGADGKVMAAGAKMSPMQAMTAGGKETIPAKYVSPALPENALKVTVPPDGKVEITLTSN